MILRVVLLTLALAWLPAAAHADDTGVAVTEIRDARFLVEPYTDSLALPDESREDWRSIPLTQLWDNPSHDLVRAWFRMTFQVSDPISTPWAVMLPRLYSGGKVFLNGVLLGEVAGSSPTTQALWLSPHRFPMPIMGLWPGENTLLVAVTSRDARIAIGAPIVGPQTVIERLYQERLFWERTVAVMSFWLLLPVAVFLAAIWYLRRQEVLYGIFSLAALAWAVRTISFIWPVVPLEFWVPWRAVYVGGTGFSIVLICIFTLRSASFHCRWIERLVLLYTASGPLTVLLLGYDFPRWESIWYAGIILFNLLTVLVIAHLAWRRRTWETFVLLVPPGLMLSAFMRYYAVKAGWLPFVNTYLAHIVAPVVVLAVCLMLLVRFVQSLARVENINVELEQRIKEREAEIKADHETLMRMELAQVSAVERQRIVQDMHDGLGSQLLSSLIMVERGAAGQKEIAQMLRECIDDMRLVMDTLSPDDNDLLSALGTLRFRMAPRLAAAGIALDWQVSCPGETVAVEPREGLAILRIVQEAIANVLKHAGGSRLSVAIDAPLGALNILIADNGTGFTSDGTDPPPAGRGLTHMKKRAAAMGADLDIFSTPAGTEIRLHKSLN